MPSFVADKNLIHVHHVGGRDGTGPYPAPRVFADDFVLYSYEADADCIDQMNAVMGRNSFKYVVRQALVGDGKGVATLHINQDPYTSSLLPPLAGQGDLYYSDSRYGDYLLSDTFRPIRQCTMPTVSFDQLVKQYDQFVDFLTLDVQGAENVLLAAASEALTTQVLGVTCEMAFAPFYENHGLFPEVFDLMRRHDFRFIRLMAHQEWSWHRAPMGWRGRGAMLQGDALFLKDPHVVLATYANPGLALMKLAITALFYGCIELMLECLDLAATHGVSPPPQGCRYLAMLAEIGTAYRTAEKVFPPVFSQLLSTEESQSRFAPDRAYDDVHRIVHTDARKRYFEQQDPRDFLNAVASIFGPEPLPLENILRTYGLQRTADQVRRDAQVQMRETLAKIGLVNTEDGAVPDIGVLAIRLGL